VWRIAAASEIGTSHASLGTPCQDGTALGIVDGGEGPVLIAVVCDGAGSAAHSDVGAQIASETLVKCARDYILAGGALEPIDRDMMVNWLAQTTERLIEVAQQEGNEPRDYACTLLVAIAGEDRTIFAQVGDGAIVISRGQEDGWLWVFWPYHGEYANQTVFILSEGATNALEFVNRPDRIDEVAIFSDGIERMVLHAQTKGVNDAFFNAMFVPIRASSMPGIDSGLSEQLKSYLGSAAVNARTSDDKTLILATRRDNGAGVE
jgi:hypothetical protein